MNGSKEGTTEESGGAAQQTAQRLLLEQERREAAEQRCIILEAQIHYTSRAPAKLKLRYEKHLLRESQKREAIEEECKALKDQVQAMSEEAGRLKELRDAAERDCHMLREQLDAMSLETMDLKKQLQMQKATSNLTPGALWQYDIKGCWHAFPPEAAEEMHQAYLEYLRDKTPEKQHATINSGGVVRIVDFALMKQKNLETRKVRSIRVLPGVPSQWETPVPSLLQQGNDLRSFYKEVKEPKIFEAVLNILQNSGHAWNASTPCSCMARAEIKSIHRIENFFLWHRYKARLAGMRQDHTRHNISAGSAELDLDATTRTTSLYQQILDCGETLASDVDEKILLHGTSWDNADAIVREGFDHRTCQHALYGAGVYFACAACKSNQYTCAQHKNNCRCYRERTLIIARVALGDAYVATETRKDARRPPIRTASSGTYDSIVVRPGPIRGHNNQRQIHQEFVIFDKEQAYPAFVVQYFA